MKPGVLKNLSVAAAIIVLLAIVFSPLVTIWLIKRHATSIVSDTLKGLSSSSLATMHVSEGFLSTSLALADERTDAAELQAMVEETRLLVDAQYERHRETLRDNTEKASFEALIRARGEYREIRSEIIGLLGAGQRVRANALFQDEGIARFEVYVKALGDLVEHNAADARRQGAEIIRLCNILLSIQLLLLVFFFIYGFFVPFTALLERLTRRPVVVTK